MKTYNKSLLFNSWFWSYSFRMLKELDLFVTKQNCCLKVLRLRFNLLMLLYYHSSFSCSPVSISHKQLSHTNTPAAFISATEESSDYTFAVFGKTIFSILKDRPAREYRVICDEIKLPLPLIVYIKTCHYSLPGLAHLTPLRKFWKTWSQEKCDVTII